MPRDYYNNTRSCVVCGKVMNRVGSRKQFCTDCCKAAKRDYERTRMRKKVPLKTYPETRCAFCNKTFIPRRYNQIYCSFDCYEENARDKGRKTFKMRDFYRVD